MTPAGIGEKLAVRPGFFNTHACFRQFERIMSAVAARRDSVSTLSHMVRAILVIILLGCATLSSDARSKPQSLCSLPQLAPGAHQSVRIAAIAESGTDMGVLTDSSCPSVQPTWFELSLRSERNRNKLHNEIERSGKAAVVLTGELFGPQQPDPKLPESIRKNYHPGWGHLGAFPQKIVVNRIESVSAIGEEAR